MTNVENAFEKDKDLKNKVFTEQLKILNKNLFLSISANFVCATLVFISLYRITNTKYLWVWYGALIVISLYRLSIFYSYRRSLPDQNYLYLFLIGTCLSASLWGIADSFLMPVNFLVVQMIIIVIVAGVTAGGIQTLQASLIASTSYVTLIILPLCFWLFSQTHFSYSLLGIAMSTYLLFLLIVCNRGYFLLTQAITLQYQNLELIQNLSVSNKRLEEAYKTVEDDEQRLREIQENAPIGMAIISLDGKWLEVNNALCRIVGYTKDELMNRTQQDISYAEDLAQELEYSEKLRHGKLSSYQLEKRFIHKNGQLVWVSLHTTMMRDKLGNPLYFIAQVQDINQSKFQEKHMAELNARTQTVLNELRQREFDMALITQMNDKLQSCISSREAYAIIRFSALELFKTFNGGLCIYNKNLNYIETVIEWGAIKNLTRTFSTKDCLALRQSNIYIFNSAEKTNFTCNHFITEQTKTYICYPLIAQNVIIGILYLSASEHEISDYQYQLINSFSEVIRQSLTNINLIETLKEQASRNLIS